MEFGINKKLRKYIRYTILLVFSIRFIPMFCFYRFSKKHYLYKKELLEWVEIILNKKQITLLSMLVIFSLPEYRSVLYFRLGRYVEYILLIFAKKQSTLFFKYAFK